MRGSEISNLWDFWMWKKPLYTVRLTKSHPTAKTNQWVMIQWLRLSIKFSFQIGLLIKIGYRIGWVHGLGLKPIFPAHLRLVSYFGHTSWPTTRILVILWRYIGKTKFYIGSRNRTWQIQKLRVPKTAYKKAYKHIEHFKIHKILF